MECEDICENYKPKPPIVIRVVKKGTTVKIGGIPFDLVEDTKLLSASGNWGISGLKEKDYV